MDKDTLFPPEAEIIINGHKLTYAESMALRVQIANGLYDYADRNALGDDEHGHMMTELYSKNLSKIQSYILENMRT